MLQLAAARENAASEFDDAPLDDPDATVRRVDIDRWFASRFADKAVRARLVQLYAFAYEVARIPEVAPQPAVGALRLKWWRSLFEDLKQRRAPTPQGRAARAMVAESDLDISLLVGMVDARARDFEDQPFETWRDLEAYVDATAGALILLAAKSCAPDFMLSQHHAEFFRRCGRVWGYTGLVRALPVWSHRRRTFFPGQLMDARDATIEGLYSGKAGHDASAMCRMILERADANYAAARRVSRRIEKEFFPAFGYVALAPLYARGFDRPLEQTAPPTVWQRKWRLFTAALTGVI